MGKTGRRGIWLGLTALVLALCPLAPRAEGPYFYDPLGSSAVYDPDFFPLNRSSGVLDLMFQVWSGPPTSESGSLSNRKYVEQFRLQWFASLDPRWRLLIDAKASGADHVVPDDYFLKVDLLYQGLDAPWFLYGGVRLPEKDEWILYLGMESLSWRLEDFFRGMDSHIPLAMRGWIEGRWTQGSEYPVARPQLMIHTLPGLSGSMVFSANADMAFTGDAGPQWFLGGHFEWTMKRGFVRPMILLGYDWEARTGVQRLSAALNLEFF
jgi:hypothetical protein